MTINHHPDISMLMSCAAGSQPEAMAAVIAAHLAQCPACAREVGRMSRIGAALFGDIDAAPLVSDAPIAAARATEAGPDAPPGAASPALADVPAHLVPLLGPSLDDVPWQCLAPGIQHCPVPLSEGAKGDLRLIRVGPGKALPEHGHGGEELTLVLRGSYADALGVFRTGDVADLDEETEHRPVADARDGCICLVASDGKARFKGLIARLMQPLTGL